MSRAQTKTLPVAEIPNLGVLLREPFLFGSDLLHRHFAEQGHPEVRAPHGAVMQFLDNEGSRVTDLARRAQITKQSMAELVGHLERHGYVERVPDPSDRRAKLVRATSKGMEVHAIAGRFITRLEREWAQRLGKAKMKQLKALLLDLNRLVAPGADEPS
jgi:DNA-binding MarR family transcriptional regulator